MLIAPENREYERHLRTYVARHAGALFNNWDFEARKDPVEAVHDLRVASRRLRALLEVLGYLVPDHASKRQALRKVTRGAGALREWDVNSEYLAEAIGHSTSHLEAAALSSVISYEKEVENEVKAGKLPDYPVLTAAQRKSATLEPKEIAARRGTAARTVQNQLSSVYRKLGVASRGELSSRLRDGEPR